MSNPAVISPERSAQNAICSVRTWIQTALSKPRNAFSFSSACTINAFRRRDVRQQSRLHTPRNPRLTRSLNSIQPHRDCHLPTAEALEWDGATRESALALGVPVEWVAVLP